MTLVAWNEIAQSLKNELPKLRWYGGKSRIIREVRFDANWSITENPPTFMCIISVSYTEGGSEQYVLPVAFADGRRAASIKNKFPKTVLHSQSDGRVAYDASLERPFRMALLESILSERNALSGRYAKRKLKLPRSSRVLRQEQSNTSIVYGKSYILKLFRRLNSGENPDIEIGRFLTDHTNFENSPAVVGTLPNPQNSKKLTTLGGLYSFIQNDGDAWSYFLSALRTQKKSSAFPVAPSDYVTAAKHPLPLTAKRAFGKTLKMAELLGKRTYDLHQALATPTTVPGFGIEKVTQQSGKILHSQIQKHCELSFHVLGLSIDKLSGNEKKSALVLLDQQEVFLKTLRTLSQAAPGSPIIRTHGDFHLGQVLVSANDFYIIDFEGEPARPISERKLKHPALRDVAGMLRSFHYASHVARGEFAYKKEIQEWFSAWHQWTAIAYLRGYFSRGFTADFLPHSENQTRQLLSLYLIEKALYELVYELNNRPAWVGVPLAGVLELISQ